MTDVEDRSAEPGRADLRPTLPGSAYVDEANFAREQERILARQWVVVGMAGELVRSGDYLTARVAGESLVAVRDAEGTVRAFHNVCRHRGSILCDQPSGSAGRSLRCPYHAWTYDLKGSLRGGPKMSPLSEADRKAYGLVPVATEVWAGFVWCNLDRDARPLAESIGREVTDRLGPEGLTPWRIDTLIAGARRSYDVAANWKLIVENFMECYHCVSIHPELTRTLPEFRSGAGTQNSANGSATFASSVEGFTLSGERRFELLAGLDERHQRRYWGMTLRPLTLLNLLPDHVIVLRIVPLSAGHTTVQCDWLFDADVVARAGFDPADTVGLFDTVNRQDFEACERCQTNMGSSVFAAGGALVPTEHHLEGFHDWIREQLA